MLRSEYVAYLGSEAWRLRRKQYLADHPECARCGLLRAAARYVYDQDLNVHHRAYGRLGAELDSDLEGLCRRCHEIEEFGSSKLKVFTPYLDAVRLCERLAVESAAMTEDGLAGLFPRSLPSPEEVYMQLRLDRR
jgi:hypothetical protein